MEGIFTPTTDLKTLIREAFREELREQAPAIIEQATAKPYLTKEELMELTGWSSRTIQNLRDTNQIPYSQHGHKILYPRKGIFEFLEAHEIEPKK